MPHAFTAALVPVLPSGKKNRAGATGAARGKAAGHSASVASVAPSRFFLVLLFAAALLGGSMATAAGAEAFLRQDDVIALVGGEDMVVAAELGYLELLLQRALPAHRLRVRSLAWEGDTVFAQPRMLNYPPLEKQLDEIGATVVLAQFGQMESLAGESKLPDFTAAYGKLIARLSGGGKRRVVPQRFFPFSPDATAYLDALARLQPGGLGEISPGRQPGVSNQPAARPEGAQDRSAAPAGAVPQGDREPRVSPGANLPQPSGLAVGFRRDGIHLTTAGHYSEALDIADRLVTFSLLIPIVTKPAGGEGKIPMLTGLAAGGAMESKENEALRQLIRAKNRLWTRSYRPENWAFLAGDRISQPSSRDHQDPAKRWFPEEMAAYGPLIAAKEAEIWALAQKLATGK